MREDGISPAGADGAMPHTVACVGVGLIGASWAAVFLAGGLEVVATDIDPGVWNGAVAAIERDLEDLGRIGPVAAGWRGRLRFEPSLEAAVADADFIQENGPESLPVKQALLQRLDRATRADAIISSSTSGISITRMQGGCRRPGRCIVGHPYTPVHLVPLVEIVGGALTDAETVSRAAAFYRALGKTVVEVHQDVPGFIGNRFQAVVLQEALSLVRSGVATVEEVDRAFTEGPGLRWALYGPFALAAFSAGSKGLSAALHHYHANRDEVLNSIERVQVNEALIRKIEDETAHAPTFQNVDKALHTRNEDLIKLRLALDATRPTYGEVGGKVRLKRM